MKRGEIYYIQHRDHCGSEVGKARPGVIVSNDALNKTSDVVEVVYLTTKTKKDLPTHAIIHATGCESTVLCEQIDSVSTLRVGDYCGTCSEEEMIAIDQCLRASLGFPAKEEEDITPELRDLLNAFEAELEKVMAERDRYAKIVDMLLAEKEGKA
jgi:mRNA interferase MazF